MRTADNYVAQVGVAADSIMYLTERFDFQRFLEDLVSDNDSVVYAMTISTANIVTGHSQADEIGKTITDPTTLLGVQEQIGIQELYYPKAGINVLEISHPAIMDGYNNGSITIGFSLEHVDKSIRNNIYFIAAIAIVSFIILGLILYFGSNYVVQVVNRLKSSVQKMEEGDFSNDIDRDLLEKNDELGEISQAISIMQEEIRNIIKNILDMAQNLAASSEELTATSQQSAIAADEVAKAIEEIADGASQQAQDTESGTISVAELGSIVKNNDYYVRLLHEAAVEAIRLKDEGLAAVATLVQKTNESGQAAQGIHHVITDTDASAEKISEASEMIKNIAEQTNLLALNAATEAARAGEAGRGFAVVADEIRKLAEQSNNFTAEIASIVEDLTSKTSSAVETMNKVGVIIGEQNQSVDETNARFNGIAKSLEDMRKSIDEVNNSSQLITDKEANIMVIMESLSAISEENAAGAEEASAAVEEQTASVNEIAKSSDQLAQMAEALNTLISRFRV